jgi:hypothetical protein
MTLDIQALKAQLREYDKSLPKCPKRIETPHYDLHMSWKTYDPCCRPEGHQGECRSTRAVLGWPGYEVLKELIDAYDAEKSQ